MLGFSPLGSGAIGADDSLYPYDYYEDISIFLPLEIRNPAENDYFQLHAKAFIDNQNSNNDYALLALHHLFMFVGYGLLYSCLRRNMRIAEQVFLIAPVRNDERRQLREISSLFTLSLINERTLFDLMRAVGCDMSSGLAELKRLVDDRNDLAHCNGKFSLDFAEDVNKYVAGFELLHVKYASNIKEHLLEIDEIDSSTPNDQQMDELVTILSNSYVSQRMIELASPAVGKEGLTNTHDLILAYLN
jgi:hypothetical protein